MPFVHARIVHEPRGIFLRFKIQQLRELHFHAGDVVIQNFLREQLTLGFCRSDRRCCRSRRRRRQWDDGRALKSAQSEQRHEIADVQRIRRRVEAAVKRDGRGDFLFQFRRVGAVGDQPAPFKFFRMLTGADYK
jgi:hypothetical protein